MDLTVPFSKLNPKSNIKPYRNPNPNPIYYRRKKARSNCRRSKCRVTYSIYPHHFFRESYFTAFEAPAQKTYDSIYNAYDYNTVD